MEFLLKAAWYSEDPLEKPDHYHDCHQIILILEGNVQYTLGNRCYTAGPGTVLLFSRYENHAIRVLSPVYRRYVLQLSSHAASLESSLYALLANRPQGFSNAVDVGSSPEAFQRLFDDILREKGKNDPFCATMQQLLVQQLLIAICRQSPTELRFDSRIHDVQRQFEADCSRDYTLEALAREYGMSPSHLSHQFKRLTGCSVMGYLLRCRLATAQHFLTATDMDISAIVEACGFSDSSNFSRTFRQNVGMSPTAFRKKYTHLPQAASI